ncbi:MerR family transcriptional regulator [Nocardioides speluncae]|uniref:MerR family transcriptional regulator n=1 Tax=Nocardioides speluncae TaxID=2670337 RepID=UPI000D69E221|nr:MerR family transcriptional regulator [Nocardioides speluncae]
MLSIGDFARHAQVSVRMLRHYDALGLLVPASVDPATGYRSYAASQLPRINRIVALKNLGFTLDQVGRILSEELSAEELRGMLRLREAELAAQIDADRVRLAAVGHRLRTIESEGTMSELEYVEKSLPAVRLAQITATVDTQAEIGPTVGPMFERLVGSLAAAGMSMAGPAVAWYGADGERVRLAAAFPTSAEKATADGVEIGELGAVERALTVVHRGSMETIGDTWQALAQQVEARGQQPQLPSREVYLETPEDDPDGWVTELQQPLA